MNVPYTCEICGKACNGHPNSRYCTKCRGEVIRRNQRERKEKDQGKQRDKAVEVDRAPSLGQIAARARALHMSYGEFVAKYGL